LSGLVETPKCFFQNGRVPGARGAGDLTNPRRIAKHRLLRRKAPIAPRRHALELAAGRRD
jgi:hypothetical protein